MTKKILAVFGGGSILPDTFVSNETEPTEDNTGPRVNDSRLTVYNGNYTPTPGEVVEKLRITGNVNLASTSSGAVFNDCVIEMGPAPFADNTPGGTYPAIDGTHGATDIVFNFCEVRPSVQSNSHNGGKGGGWLLNRCKIKNVVDGLNPQGSGSRYVTAICKDTYIAELSVFDDPRQSDGITHNDDCQAFGKADLRIMGSALHGGRTSCILIQQAQPSWLYIQVLVEYNWLYGNDTTGSTINITDATDGTPVNNLTVRYNKVYRSLKSPRFLVAQNTRLAGSTDIHDNVYMDDGSPVPVSPG